MLYSIEITVQIIISYNLLKSWTIECSMSKQQVMSKDSKSHVSRLLQCDIVAPKY
jgi:hypothetical protein